ncbi:AMP-binding protein [Diaphorobacter ruginosibacter]|uniref:AMP-binding protein n=1 Tax=Diaphorobacter ruginosibacter TaxID=1715720 RepID=A0A7G9RU21_9BURK|nr:AMP-binding protein [Diaphorobacter ruginosibacter]QNN59096.1 AMP-binding protein [Diaphorobacter ruginosibacter]
MRVTASDLPNFRTLGELITHAIATHPDHVAFVDADGLPTTYEQLGHKIAWLIAELRRLGLRRGDVVAQLCGNRTEMFCLMAAAYVGGFCSVTLHAMAGADDHAAILEDCKAKIFVYEHYFAERAKELRQRSASAMLCRSHDATDEDESIWGQSPHAPSPSPSPAHAHALQPVGEPEDIVRLAYTGGTTGRSKGVMLSNRAMLTNARLWLDGLEWQAGVRTLCSAPISHGAGSLIFPTLGAGGTIYLQRGFSAASWLRCVQYNHITHTFIVPTMLYALLDHADTARHGLTSLRALVYGAAPASPSRIRAALNLFGPVLVQTYGQTEAPNTILILDQQAHQRATDAQLASAGIPFPHVNVVLTGDDDRPVSTGETGELCLTGDLLMSGYHGLPEQTARTLANGLLHTGDLARMGEDGLIYIVDRKKDMIISGGFNVYPKEVEDVLGMHPDVAAAAVFGVPDPKWGEAVRAVVVPRSGASVDPHALIEFVRARKGAVCTPKSIELVDQVPLTSLGKPDKKALRNLYSSHPSRETA